MNAFQESLAELIEEKHISRLALAKQIGVSSTTINGYFNNGYYPQIDIAAKMADFFECNLDYLFGLSDEREPKKPKISAQNFAENFYELICSLGLSISAAMKKLDMSEYDFYRWRKGKMPKTVNIVLIAKTFSTSVEDLFK